MLGRFLLIEADKLSLRGQRLKIQQIHPLAFKLDRSGRNSAAAAAAVILAKVLLLLKLNFDSGWLSSERAQIREKSPSSHLFNESRIEKKEKIE